MSVISTALRHLMAAGMSGDDLLRAVEEIEAALHSPASEPDTRTASARRQAAYRERKEMGAEDIDVTDDVTSDVTDVTLRNGRNDQGFPQKKQQSKLPSQTPLRCSPLSPQAALDIWNEMARRAGLPEAISATGKRLAMLRQRLTDHGEEGYRRAVLAVERSDFCCGKNDRNWKADLGFMLRPDAFVRLMEGGYGSDRKLPGDRSPMNADQLRAAIAFAEDHDNLERAAELKSQLAELTARRGSAAPVSASIAKIVAGVGR